MADDELRAVLRDLLDDCAMALDDREPELTRRCRAAIGVLDRPPVAPVDSPRLPPMHDAPTTQAMRERALPRAGTLRLRLLALIDGSRLGMTDDELEQATGRAHQSVSAVRNGLVADGWLARLVHEGESVTRPTRYGNEAQVWVLSPRARGRLTAEHHRQGG